RSDETDPVGGTDLEAGSRKQRFVTVGSAEINSFTHTPHPSAPPTRARSHQAIRSTGYGCQRMATSIDGPSDERPAIYRRGPAARLVARPAAGWVARPAGGLVAQPACGLPLRTGRRVGGATGGGIGDASGGLAVRPHAAPGMPSRDHRRFSDHQLRGELDLLM